MKQHYEKVITGCGFLFIFANMGLASTAFSVHQPYLVALPGIGDTGGSLILSVRTLTSFLAMLIVDRYYRLLDVRLGVSVACLFTCAGFAVYSFASSLPMFFCGAVLLGLGYGFGGMVAMTYLANRWFSSGIGSVVGFGSMGSGLASIVIPLIVVRIIQGASLSAAFLFEGVLAAVIGIVAFALLRNRPSDMGMAPYAGKNDKVRRRGGRRNAGTSSSGAREGRPSTSAPIEPAVAPSAGERLLLMAALVFVGTYSCCGITYLSVLATSSGFDPVFAAVLVSIAGVALTVAKFLTGELFDYLGGPKASAIMFALGFVGFVLCCFAGTGSAVLMVVGAITVGAGLSLGSVGVSVWSLDLSQPENRTRQVKNFQVAYALGGFIANTLPGIVKDLAGTYVVSYAAAAAIIVLAAFIVLRFYRKYK